MNKFVHFDNFTNMEYNERKQKRKEISDFNKKMNQKGLEMLLERNTNSDIRLKLENGTITPKEVEEVLKARLNKVDTIKIKGKGKFVKENEQLELMKKHDLIKKSVPQSLQIISDIDKDFEKSLEINDLEVVKCEISKLKPHPHNYRIYEKFNDEDEKLKNDFIQSVETYGILEPLVVNSNYEIISGHRRYFSALQIGLEFIPIRIKDFENEVVAIIHFNKQREKNGTIIRNEFNELDNYLFKKLGGRGRKKDSIDIYNTISEIFNISRGSATKLYKIYTEDKELFVKVKLPQNPNGTYSIDKAYFSLDSVKKGSVSKRVNEKNYVTMVKNSLPNITTNELFEILKTTYPFSMMGEFNKVEGYTNITLNDTKLAEFETKRKELIDDLELKKSLSTEELLMFEKFDEIERTQIDSDISKKVMNDLWKPIDITNESVTIKQIESLVPKLVLMSGDEYFNALRIFTSSVGWNPNVGRNLKYLVRDEITDKILGCIVVGSDVLHLEGRDKKIGWGIDDKIGKKRLNNICIATTIIPTFLLGYNFLGTKLIASMVQSETIQNDWKERYGDILVGITTTSLYGSFSSYNGIPNWNKCGLSKGKVILNPSYSIYKFWYNWYKKNYNEEFLKSTTTDNNTITTGPKQRIMKGIFSLLNIKHSDYHHSHQRGVYFFSVYDNSIDFLNSKISESELKKKKVSLESILGWWKPKAVQRYKKLLEEGRLEKDFYWYEKMSEKELKEWLMNRGKHLILND